MEQRWRGTFPVTLKQCVSAHQPCGSCSSCRSLPHAHFIFQRSSEYCCKDLAFPEHASSLKAFSKRGNHVPLNRQTASTGGLQKWLPAKVAVKAGGPPLLLGCCRDAATRSRPDLSLAITVHTFLPLDPGAVGHLSSKALYGAHMLNPSLSSLPPPTAACCSLTLSGVVISAIRTRGVFSIRGPC